MSLMPAAGQAGRTHAASRKLISAGTRVGVTPYNWRLLKSTRHAQLHLQARPVAPPPYDEREPHTRSATRTSLCASG